MVVMDVGREDPKLRMADRGTARSAPAVASGWTPLAGDALLDRLRVTGRARPLADPERVARLRDTLEHGLDPGSVASRGSGGQPSVPGSPSPLVITKDLLTRALDRHSDLGARTGAASSLTVPMACGALVDGLFRQLVTTGSIGNPMRDGMDALALDDRQRDLVTWIDNLSPTERGALTAEVDRQCLELVARWPRLDPSWLPRTQVPMRVGLADGSIELSGRVDLAIGRPGFNVASVAIVEVKSGARRPEHRSDLHFYALVETLRSPAPPFAVATYYTRTGELDVDPVSDELLASAARRTVAGVMALCPPTAGAVVSVPATGRPGKAPSVAAGGSGRRRAVVTASGGGQ